MVALAREKRTKEESDSTEVVLLLSGVEKMRSPTRNVRRILACQALESRETRGAGRLIRPSGSHGRRTVTTEGARKEREEED
jgi:hypothetical protein